MDSSLERKIPKDTSGSALCLPAKKLLNIVAIAVVTQFHAIFFGQGVLVLQGCCADMRAHALVDVVSHQG